jgi:N-acetylglucosamine-6-phosphate deacetylase
MLAFAAAELWTPEVTIEEPLMLVDQGRIVEVRSGAGREFPGRGSTTDFGDSVMAPGYFDLHIHGGAGFDVMDEESSALPAIERLLAKHGVTSYFPTTVTAPMDRILRALEHLGDVIKDRERRFKDGQAGLSGGAIPLGIHLEGPFISHARRGVHPAGDLLPPRVETFERFWQAARGRIRMMTIAPELDGALEVIAAAVDRGVCVSLGHSDANFAAAERGVDAGGTHATHTFNAMRPLDHRSPGILGEVLTDVRVSADVIADGIHLDPAIIKLVAQAKGPEQTVLITDATAATGMPDGRYRLGSIEVEVHDGKCTAGGKLAGSVLTMDRAVTNMARFAEWDLPRAVAAASCNPARVAKCKSKGALVAGADADFIVTDKQGRVLRTFIGGLECSGIA